MHIPLTPAVVLLFAVVAQAVFAAGLLWTARHNQQPNRFLALLMLVLALWVLDGFFRESTIYRQNPSWYFAPIYYSFAFGPLLYFYVRSLVNHDFQLRPHHFWHFVPVLVQAVLYWWLRFQSYETRNWFWQTVHQPYTYRMEFIGTWVSLLIYLLLSLRLLREYRRWLVHNFSEVSQLRLRWLRVLLVAVGVVSVQWLVEVVLREFWGMYYRYDFSTELLGGTVLVLGVVGLRQADMRVVHFDASAPGPDEADPAYAAGLRLSAASKPEHDEPDETATVTSKPPVPAADPAVVARIQQALETDRLYLNPTLTLAELAAHTGLPPRLVSFTINQGFGQSFNDLVNRYRVEEVKRRLATSDVERLTLLGIAFECGFNSKTTFNRMFKQFTGVAPRDYQPPQ